MAENKRNARRCPTSAPVPGVAAEVLLTTMAEEDERHFLMEIEAALGPLIRVPPPEEDSHDRIEKT